MKKKPDTNKTIKDIEIITAVEELYAYNLLVQRKLI